MTTGHYGQLRSFGPAAWRAASLLSLILAGVVFLAFWGGAGPLAVLPAAPFALLGLGGQVSYRRWAARKRLRAVVDWVAEREMAAGQPRACRTPARSATTSRGWRTRPSSTAGSTRRARV